jgi:hypothetical protein
MDAKPITQSKTFWFNAAFGGLAAADHIIGSGVLGPETTAIAVPVLAGVNIFLRSITDKRVKWK